MMALKSTLTQEDIQRKPWKYVGYRGYAKFIASEDDLFVLRRFDTLNARIALLLQDEVAELEKSLCDLDEEYNRKDAADVDNGSLRNDQRDRAELLRNIRQKLQNYNDFLLQQTALKKYQRAPRRDIKSTRNWHYNHDYAAIVTDEEKYLDYEKDLICVVEKDKTPLRRVIDNSKRLRTLSLWRRKDNETPEYDANVVSYYSDKRIDGFASGIIVTIGVIPLLTPIWILQALGSPKHKLAVITVFIFVFLLTLSFAMVAKPFEAPGATAAYAAVLMVFLQFGDSSS